MREEGERREREGERGVAIRLPHLQLHARHRHGGEARRLATAGLMTSTSPASTTH